MKYVQSSVIQMEVMTYPFKWKVTRSHADFVVLREYLLRKYPQTIIPPLPRFNVRKRLTHKQIVKREVYYQRFLQSVMRSMILRTSDFLVDFLKESDTHTFMVRSLSAQQEEGPRKLNDIATLGGEIDVQAKKSARQFCDNFDSFITTYAEINNYIASKCKVIQSKAHDLADEFFGVASEIQRFAALLRSTEIP